jgi:hypothetical protein
MATLVTHVQQVQAAGLVGSLFALPGLQDRGIELAILLRVLIQQEIYYLA